MSQADDDRTIALELRRIGAVNVLDHLIRLMQDHLQHEPSTGTEHARFLQEWLGLMGEMIKQEDPTGKIRRELAQVAAARRTADDPQKAAGHVLFRPLGQKPKH